MSYKIPFGDVRIGSTARKYIQRALDSNRISEGANTREFEHSFAEKFGWKYAIACSSGTDAGIVVWSAVRELRNNLFGKGYVFTPACAFVATANCLLAAGYRPRFIDVKLDTLNMNVDNFGVAEFCIGGETNIMTDGFQFVATMGSPRDIRKVAAIAKDLNLYLIGDFCEAHGAQISGGYADHFCDASIYSFYAAHLIVGGEGGIICTDDDELADMCRSIKSHGRPAGSIYFDFQRPGFNSKWTEFCAAVALESLERFDENFTRRREVRQKLIEALEPMEDKLILYRDDPGEIISPHAFPILLRDESTDIQPLYEHMDKAGIQVKTLFGSLPTNHAAFRFLGYKLGDFPVAERIGRTGLHLPCNEFMTDDDVIYVAEKIGEFFQGKKP